MLRLYVKMWLKLSLNYRTFSIADHSKAITTLYLFWNISNYKIWQEPSNKHPTRKLWRADAYNFIRKMSFDKYHNSICKLAKITKRIYTHTKITRRNCDKAIFQITTRFNNSYYKKSKTTRLHINNMHFHYFPPIPIRICQRPFQLDLLTFQIIANANMRIVNLTENQLMIVSRSQRPSFA